MNLYFDKLDFLWLDKYVRIYFVSYVRCVHTKDIYRNDQLGFLHVLSAKPDLFSF